jgi:hypothetical protein
VTLCVTNVQDCCDTVSNIHFLNTDHCFLINDRFTIHNLKISFLIHCNHASLSEILMVFGGCFVQSGYLKKKMSSDFLDRTLYL